MLTIVFYLLEIEIIILDPNNATTKNRIKSKAYITNVTLRWNEIQNRKNNKNIGVRTHVSTFIQRVCFAIHLNIFKPSISINATLTHLTRGSQSLGCVLNFSIWQVILH